MKIERALPENLEEILELQKLAFQSQAKIYDDDTLPPLVQTLEEIKKDYASHVFLKVVSSSKIIGSVKGSIQENTCHIGRLIVHPDHQNQGIGKQLMEAIENHFDEAQVFELFTGHKSEKNIHVYESLGYETFKIEEEDGSCNAVKLLHMRKNRKSLKID